MTKITEDTLKQWRGIYCITGHNAILTTRDNIFYCWRIGTVDNYYISLEITLFSTITCIEVLSQSFPIKIFCGIFGGFIMIMDINPTFDNIQYFKEVIAHDDPLTIISSIILCPFRNLCISCGNDKISFMNYIDEKVISKINICFGDNKVIAVDQVGMRLFVGGPSKRVQEFKINLDPQPYVDFGLSIIINDYDACNMIYIRNYDKIVIGYESGNIHLYNIQEDCKEYYTITNHNSKIILLKLIFERFLLSVSKNGMVLVTDLNLEKKPVRLWQRENSCTVCDRPFFWNIFRSIKMLQLGSRRHHCRICGRSLCSEHSSFSSASYIHGFEYPVIICNECMSFTDNKPINKSSSFNTIACVIADFDIISLQLVVSYDGKPITVVYMKNMFT